MPSNSRIPRPDSIRVNNSGNPEAKHFSNKALVTPADVVENVQSEDLSSQQSISDTGMPIPVSDKVTSNYRKEFKAIQDILYSENTIKEYIFEKIGVDNPNLGLYHPLFFKWLETEEGYQLLEQVKLRLNIYLDSSLTKIVEKCVIEIFDRVDNGTHRYNKRTNKMERIPLSAEQLSKIFATVFDRRQLLRNKPTYIASEQKNLEILADKLANQAKNMVSVTVINTSGNEENGIIEGEFANE